MENIPNQKLSTHLRTCRGLERSATASNIPSGSAVIAAQLNRAVALNRAHLDAQRASHHDDYEDVRPSWQDEDDQQQHVFRAAEAAERGSSGGHGATSGGVARSGGTHSSGSVSRFVPKKTVLGGSGDVGKRAGQQQQTFERSYGDEDEEEVRGSRYDQERYEDELEEEEMGSAASPPIASTKPAKLRKPAPVPEWDAGGPEDVPAAAAGPTDNRHPCQTCGRKFLELDRLEKHTIACSKMQKPRKQYDATKARVKGTELESYAGKARTEALLADDSRPKHGKPAATFTHDATPIAPAKRPANWRVKHDKFIQMVRAARQPDGSPGASGSTASLASEPDPDLVPCEHCNRRFQKDTAARHIPFCKESKQKNHYRNNAVRPGANGSGIGGSTGSLGGALSREEMVKKRTAYKPPVPKTRLRSPTKQ
ncbi:Zinc finger C2HC domain-containing protein 1A [Thoreauomyces humboldtii]|nr:Zinc finger C2HC domain-containing protein 1A [Thoreauomyces humboldtii]